MLAVNIFQTNYCTFMLLQLPVGSVGVSLALTYIGFNPKLSGLISANILQLAVLH